MRCSGRRSCARGGRAPGPATGRLVIDVDSFVGEVCGRLKQGAAYGYTKLLGYHPILATRADTREVLHIRLRKGSANTQKGMLRFTDELIARVARAGANGVKLLRADSGFWNDKVFKRLEQAGWQYSIGVRMQKGIREAVEAIDEDAWQTIDDYPEEGEAQIAETTYGGRRLIVRRTRLLGAQAQLWPDWRHFAFITNRTEDIALVEAEHRDHAVVEQVIADLKDQALAHFPSGEFNANGAWTVLGALAHNLLRWTQLIGLPDTTVRAARTLRRRLASDRRPADPPRPILDASPPRPLALARRLHHRARADPRAPRRLTHRRASNESSTHRPEHDHPCSKTTPIPPQPALGPVTRPQLTTLPRMPQSRPKSANPHSYSVDPGLER